VRKTGGKPTEHVADGNAQAANARLASTLTPVWAPSGTAWPCVWGVAAVPSKMMIAARKTCAEKFWERLEMMKLLTDFV